MTWAEACDDPTLQDLPYRIELNKWGNLEMSPVPPTRHGETIGQICFYLCEMQTDGMVSVCAAVDTAENTKVVDAVWISLVRRRGSQSEYSYTCAPEICVEVMHTGNHLEEQLHRGQLYFQAGAEEFWLCDERGHMQFFNVHGPLERSQLCPDFPVEVEIPD